MRAQGTPVPWLGLANTANVRFATIRPLKRKGRKRPEQVVPCRRRERRVLAHPAIRTFEADSLQPISAVQTDSARSSKPGERSASSERWPGRPRLGHCAHSAGKDRTAAFYGSPRSRSWPYNGIKQETLRALVSCGALRKNLPHTKVGLFLVLACPTKAVRLKPGGVSALQSPGDREQMRRYDRRD
jgi:hypothetical protein